MKKAALVLCSIVEVAAARGASAPLIDSSLESVMALFSISVLMGLAGIDGLSLQAIVSQQVAVMLLEQFPIAKVIHRGSEPTGAVQVGAPFQFPEGILKPLGQGSRNPRKSRPCQSPNWNRSEQSDKSCDQIVGQRL